MIVFQEEDEPKKSESKGKNTRLLDTSQWKSSAKSSSKASSTGSTSSKKTSGSRDTQGSIMPDNESMSSLKASSSKAKSSNPPWTEVLEDEEGFEEEEEGAYEYYTESSKKHSQGDKWLTEASKVSGPKRETRPSGFLAKESKRSGKSTVSEDREGSSVKGSKGWAKGTAKDSKLSESQEKSMAASASGDKGNSRMSSEPPGKASSSMSEERHHDNGDDEEEEYNFEDDEEFEEEEATLERGKPGESKRTRRRSASGSRDRSKTASQEKKSPKRKSESYQERGSKYKDEPRMKSLQDQSSKSQHKRSKIGFPQVRTKIDFTQFCPLILETSRDWLKLLSLKFLRLFRVLKIFDCYEKRDTQYFTSKNCILSRNHMCTIFNLAF